MKTILGVLLLATALAGCGGADNHTVDVKAWQTDLAQQGVHVQDWPKYQSVYADLCDDPSDQLALFLTLRDAPPKSQVRTAFKYQCPDQAGKLDDAYASVGNATSNVDQACDTPRSERTEEQQQLAEAMRC